MKSNTLLKSLVLACFLFGNSIAAEKIAYVRLTVVQKPDGGTDEKDPTIFISDSDGKNPVEVVKGAYPDISADGKSLVYIQGPEGKRIFDVMVRNLETGATTNITNNMKSSYHPNLSGNGRYLAFSTPIIEGEKTKNQIVIYDMENLSNPPEIIATAVDAYFPRLSSDGRFVVFHQTFEKTDFFSGKIKQVFMYDRMGKDPAKRLTEITKGDEYCFEPALSMDDRQIAFTCRTTPDEKYKTETNLWIAQTYNRTAPRAQVTNDGQYNLAPVFTVDGSIVYSATEGNLRKLFTAHKNSDGTYKLSAFAGEDGYMFYSPSSSGDLGYVGSKGNVTMKDVRTSFAALNLASDTVMVVGGQIKGQHTHMADAITGESEILKFDGEIQGDAIKARPHTAEGFGAVQHGDKIYAFGGLTAKIRNGKDFSYSIDAIDVYDLKKKNWKTLKTKLLHPRSSHDVAVFNDKAYIIGGWNYDDDFANAQKGSREGEGRYLSSIEVFDFVTQTISEFKVPLKDNERRAFDTVVTTQGIFLVGGMAGGDVGFLDRVTLFNPNGASNDEVWKEYPALPCPSFAPAASVIDDEMYFFGGYCKYSASHSSVRLSNHIYKMNLHADHVKWDHTGRYMNESRAFFQVVPNSDEGVFMILGGTSSKGPTDQATVNSIEEFGIPN